MELYMDLQFSVAIVFLTLYTGKIRSNCSHLSINHTIYTYIVIQYNNLYEGIDINLICFMYRTIGRYFL